jgi:hypothetical protein
VRRIHIHILFAWTICEASEVLRCMCIAIWNITGDLQFCVLRVLFGSSFCLLSFLHRYRVGVGVAGVTCVYLQLHCI